MNPVLSHSFIFCLAIIPSIGWMMVYRFLDSRDREPKSATLLGLFMGIVSTIPVFAMQFIFSQYPEFNLVSIVQQNISSTVVFSVLFLLFVAFIEETAKAVAFLFLVNKTEKYFNQVVDGIFYGALVGIGFALAENIYYFMRALETFSYSSNFLAIFTIRSFGTMLAHTLFTGIFGFYFAKAYFSPFINEESRQEKIWQNLRKNAREAIRLHATFFHLMPKKQSGDPSFNRNVIILEGYLIAILVHFLYNGFIKLELFGQNWTFLIIPLVFVVAWYVWSRFFVRVYTRIVDFVRIRKGIYKLRVH
jgi:RsiW-degrading membrane proteinase PrsW (M82 family)